MDRSTIASLESYFRPDGAAVFVVFAIVMVMGYLGVVIRLHRVDRNTRPAQPPSLIDTPPAVMLALTSWNRLQEKSFTATLLDLARRGYVHLRQSELPSPTSVSGPLWLFEDWIIQRTNQPDVDLLDFEKLTLRYLLQGNDSTSMYTTLEHLSRSACAEFSERFVHQTKASAVMLGLVSDNKCHLARLTRMLASGGVIISAICTAAGLAFAAIPLTAALVVFAATSGLSIRQKSGDALIAAVDSLRVDLELVAQGEMARPSTMPLHALPYLAFITELAPEYCDQLDGLMPPGLANNAAEGMPPWMELLHPSNRYTTTTLTIFDRNASHFRMPTTPTTKTTVGKIIPYLRST